MMKAFQVRTVSREMSGRDKNAPPCRACGPASSGLLELVSPEFQFKGGTREVLKHDMIVCYSLLTLSSIAGRQWEESCICSSADKRANKTLKRSKRSILM